MSTLWSLHHQRRSASAAEIHADRAADRVGVLTQEIRHLQARVGQLAMVSEALWTLLRDQTGWTDDVLLERIRAIDLLDGQLDGKVVRPPAACPKCQRTLSQRHQHCIYCGAQVERGPFG